MQLNAVKNGRQEVPLAACADIILEGLPPVMWYIRCKMRQHDGSGLSVPQYRALFFIDRYKDASLSQVSDHLGCTLPTSSRLISGLVRRKFLIRKTSSNDGRQKVLTTTRKGRSVLAISINKTKKNLEAVINQLSSSQRQEVHQAMTTLKQIFSKQSVRNI